MYLTFNNWIEFENILTNDLIVKKIYYLDKMKEIMKTHQNHVDLGWKNFFNVFAQK
jgi:DNA recombination-dependent growth factor C